MAGGRKGRPKHLQGPETIQGGQLRTLFLKKTKTLKYQNLFSAQCNLNITLNRLTRVKNTLCRHEVVCMLQGGIFPLDKLSLGLGFTGALILMGIMFGLLLILTEDDHVHFIDKETRSELLSDSPGSGGQGARL